MSLAWPDRVRVVEVGPRDGLQNEPQPVPVAARVALVEALAAAGLETVEAGSFVSPRWVPQMAESDKVLAALTRRPGHRYPVLVPNAKGLAAALAAGAKEIAVFAAASESFSRRNINCSIAESLARFAPLVAEARAAGLWVRGYVSCVVACPYEGAVAPAAVAEVAAALDAMGCAEISLGETLGTATAAQARAMLAAVSARIPAERLAVHYHDTYGQALANVLASLDLGIATVDASVAGLGGCPYAPGASGNLATEDLVWLLDGLGIESGVDLEAVAAAGRRICQVLGRPPAGRAAGALMARP